MNRYEQLYEPDLYRRPEGDPHELLGEINQALIDLDNTEDTKEKAVYKAWIDLKINYLKGLVKGL